MTSQRVLKLVVTVPATPGVSRADWADYVRDAVKSYAGGLDPEEAIYGFNRNAVNVAVKTYIHEEGFGCDIPCDPKALIADQELSTRVQTILKHAGILTIQQLCDSDRERLLRLPNMGLKSIAELTDFLASTGYSFGYFRDEENGWNGTNLNNATHWHMKYKRFMWDDAGMSSPRMWIDSCGWGKSHWTFDGDFLPRENWTPHIQFLFDQALSAPLTS